MYVVEVILLQKSTYIERLSYYSSTEISVGSLIMVPVRKKESLALVVDNKPVYSIKVELRKASFSLRKLPSGTKLGQLSKTLIATATELSSRYPVSVGAILHEMIPTDVKNGKRPYPKTFSGEPFDKKTASEITTLTGTANYRQIVYRSLIRETFARHGSVRLLVPSGSYLPNVLDSLSTGIENRVVTFSSYHTKKQLDQSYDKFINTKEPILIIATGSYAYLERPDIKTVIIENAGCPYYKQKQRPYLDQRDMLTTNARLNGQFILLGDIVLRTEDEVARREDVYLTYDEEVQRFQFSAPMVVVERPAPHDPAKKFRILNKQTCFEIENCLSRKGKVFIYAARRGLAPAVLCRDCGYLFRCPDSGAPYSLHRTFKNGNEYRWFISHTSGKKVPASHVCPICNSWRLREQGIGIQWLESEVRQFFSNAELIVFDHTTARTYKQAMVLSKRFSTTKGVIMLGTNMAIPFLPPKLDLTVVSSYEAARAQSTWRADEYLLSLLLTLREKSDTASLVQTRGEPDTLIHYVSKGQISKFYNEEIQLREELRYPPFYVFILLTISGSKEFISDLENAINSILTGYDIFYYQTPGGSGEKYIKRGLIRIPRDSWPDAQLCNMLRSLPPSVAVMVNPDRII